jgi:hypothetical protein
MDTIDITSSEFSLGRIAEVNDVIPNATISLGDNLTDYNLYIYIGIIILVGVIAYFVYKYYATNAGKRVTFQDKLEECYGEDVCER